ncbi:MULTISPECIES: hypothetical protein [unclassified Streptomyces]|uniref:hypothetical protein n=1 Tax=unclassified Streptomyces TaxID=2593676 RepID=UPI001907813C|nr:hypothetical protein [Streptomyces sp. HSG2]
MPRGRYSLHDPLDHTPLGEEHFHCALGPSGWRYVSRTTTPAGDDRGSVDLTLDALGRPLRLELSTGPWRVRGGVSDGLAWVRTDLAGTRAIEGTARAHGFAGTSPALLVAATRLLRLTPSSPSGRLRLVAFTEPVLAPRTVDRSWTVVDTQTHATDNGPLLVDEYGVTALDTGERHTVHVAGDVVLAAPGVELEALDSPPSVFPRTRVTPEG